MRLTVSKFLLSISCCQYLDLCLAKVLNEDKLLSQSLGPVILIPGDGGCQVQGKWNKPTTVGYFCAKTEPEWTDLWLSISELSPYAIYCFVDNVRLEYNRDNKTTSNSPGVETRIPGFGSTDTVDWLDTAIHVGITEYFSAITESLVKKGYQKNITIRGAPFDFRKAPNELQNYYTDLHDLIEETYEINNKLKVTLIAHSMGAPILHSFLNGQLQTWKDTYIQSIISLSGAWGGSVKPVKVYAIGDNLGSRLLSASILRPLQISFPSLAFLMPSQELWGSPEDIIISTPEKNYTIFDIEEYFIALNNTDGYEMYKNSKDVLYNIPPPQVEIHCLHGLQVPTTNRLFYPTQKDFPWSPTIMTGDGDGTVNQRSLELCLKWARKQKQKIYHKIFPKVDHMQILTEKTVVDYISQYLSSVQMSNVKLLKLRSKTLQSVQDHSHSTNDNLIEGLVQEKKKMALLKLKEPEFSTGTLGKKHSTYLTTKINNLNGVHELSPVMEESISSNNGSTSTMTNSSLLSPSEDEILINVQEIDT